MVLIINYGRNVFHVLCKYNLYIIIYYIFQKICNILLYKDYNEFLLYNINIYNNSNHIDIN